jgi:hypothetical protein
MRRLKPKENDRLAWARRQTVKCRDFLFLLSYPQYNTDLGGVQALHQVVIRAGGAP